MKFKGLNVRFSDGYTCARQILPGRATRLAAFGARSVDSRP